MTKTRINTQNHSTYYCRYHIVWTTKWRNKSMEERWVKDEIVRILIKISKWKGFEIHSYHIGLEHIHLYITIPPRYSISYAMSVIKGKTSKWIKKKMTKMGDKSIWSKGYFVSTIGINEMAVKKYIENQDRPKVRDVQMGMISQA